MEKTSCFDRAASLISRLIRFGGAARLTVFKLLFFSPHSETHGSQGGWQAVAESITTAQHNLYCSLKWFYCTRDGKCRSLKLCNAKRLLNAYLLDRALVGLGFLFGTSRAGFSK